MLVSIIVPVFKVEKYLKRCIESLCNQSYKDIEIILIDDGSPDRSGEICDEFAAKNSYVKVFHQKNLGLSAARNKGIDVANGEYISFVDSDDFIDEHMIESMVSLSEVYNADIVICSWKIIRGHDIQKSHFTMSERVLTPEEAIKVLLNPKGFDNFAWNKMFRKELFESIIFPVGKVMEDLATIYKLILKANRIAITPLPLYLYDIHSDSITSRLYDQINPDVFDIYVKRKDDLLLKYPNLRNLILSNFFLACRDNFMIAVRSTVRFEKFEKKMLLEMRNNYKYFLICHSNNWNSKFSCLFLCLFPYIYIKVKHES